MKQFSTIEEAVEVIAGGGMVIVVDSEDRENEGDVVCAAETVTAETVHFMISEARGQLCMPLLDSAARRLGLEPMVQQADDLMPVFTIPIDHHLCKTGISPQERAFTIRNIADPTTNANDFVKPGHIFPLVAQENGVLRRPGHTEATVDLARMAGLTPAGILCEVCSRNGKHMAEVEELMEMSDRFDLPIISIDALIEFRLKLSGGKVEPASLLAPRYATS